MLKSRKKMLLSSIAMLLVALIALGTATFAWYANVQTVSAETTQFSASVSQGLTIRHRADSYTGTTNTNDKVWKTALNTDNLNQLSTTSSLSPASITYEDIDLAIGKRGATAVAAAPDNSSRGSNALSGIEDITSSQYAGNYLIDEMWVASESNSAVDVTFTINGSGPAVSANSYLVIAVYVDGDFVEAFTSHTGYTTTSKVTYAAATGYDDATGQDLTPFTGGTTYQVVGGTDTTFQAKPRGADGTDGGTHVQIVAFANGYDTNCKTTAVDPSTLSVKYQFDIA